MLRFAAAFAAAATLGATGASALTLALNHNADDFDVGVYSTTGSGPIAQSFVTTGSSPVIFDVVRFGGAYVDYVHPDYVTGAPSNPTFHVRIYEDDGGAPGATLTYSASTAFAQDLGYMVEFYEAYDHWMEVSETYLLANSTYWITIEAVAEEEPAFLWLLDADKSPAYSTWTGDGWEQSAGEGSGWLDFSLHLLDEGETLSWVGGASVPLPAAAPLLAAGVAGLALAG
ncbi:MAG: hypothetical protein VX463_00045, partial [Pseudomonadota bacterium]|nr:hypothetical protein [Pseudomonadota bacterium]